MSTMTSITNNYATFRVEGTVALSAAGAVGATKGDGVTVTKTDTGLYRVDFANHSGLVLNENLGAGAHLIDAAVGTVKDVGVMAQFTQDADTGVLSMYFRTVDAAGADADEATDALTVAFYGVFRYARMTHPFE